MNVTVYCGSTFGINPCYNDAAIDLGKFISSKGYTLVYGGGRTGLMGTISSFVLENEGEVIGVIPEFLKIQEGCQDDLTSLETVETMSERKDRMIELGDAFIALPGGPGTLEEISEIISLKRLNRIEGPCILFNNNDFYTSFETFLDKMVEEGFYPSDARKSIYFPKTISEIERIFS